MRTCWKEQIEYEMGVSGETWEDVVSKTITEEELLVEFDNSYGSKEGIPFTLWTKNRVYFPCVYDGSAWVYSVSRNPDGISTLYIGNV